VTPHWPSPPSPSAHSPSAQDQSLTLRGGTLLTPSGLRPGWDVAIAGSSIASVGQQLAAAPTDLDVSGLYVLPGFVDVHVHGAAGTTEPAEMARFLPSTGVTSFLPTLAASSPDDTLAFVAQIARLENQDRAAEVLGTHLEGPFLSAERCGAQPRQHLRQPDTNEIERLIAVAAGTLRRMTLASELPRARDVIRRLIAAGVQVSLGHSSCTHQQALQAARWGATSVTHTYNAMAPFHHREPGLIGAALTAAGLLAELIADGIHVHPAAALTLIRARGPEAVAIVTDGLTALGLPPGPYAWSGRPITSDGAVARLEDGALAGSATTMNQAFRNLLGWGVPLEQAATMLSRTPAILAGAPTRKGLIAPAFDADLIILDSDLRLAATYCRGQLAWTTSGTDLHCF
jgi:N-acetylglucosamine-6-phosphate deacetylase